MLIKLGSPFYKNPTLWLVVLLPLTTVIVGIAFVVFSIKHYDGVVVDDYYKQGKQINQTIERDEAASLFGLSAMINLNAEKKLVNVILLSKQDFDYPEKIKLNFIHRTVSAQDMTFELIRQQNNNYLAVLPQLTETNWQVELGTVDWRLRGQFSYPQQTEFSLSAKGH